MSITGYKCNWCGEAISGASHTYSETIQFPSTLHNGNQHIIIGVLSIGPVTGDFDMCNVCRKK